MPLIVRKTFILQETLFAYEHERNVFRWFAFETFSLKSSANSLLYLVKNIEQQCQTNLDIIFFYFFRPFPPFQYLHLNSAIEQKLDTTRRDTIRASKGQTCVRCKWPRIDIKQLVRARWAFRVTRWLPSTSIVRINHSHGVCLINREPRRSCVWRFSGRNLAVRFGSEISGSQVMENI